MHGERMLGFRRSWLPCSGKAKEYGKDSRKRSPHCVVPDSFLIRRHPTTAPSNNGKRAEMRPRALDLAAGAV
jgi:hypothetical protein